MKHSAFARIIALDRMIRTKRLESTEQAARDLGTSRRSVERDLEDLRRDMGADLVYNRKIKRYEYRGDPVTLPAQWLNTKDIATVLIAERALRLYTGAFPAKEVHPAFNRFLDPIRQDKKVMYEIRELCKSVFFHRPYQAERDVKREFTKLLDAIMERRRVAIAYKSAKNEVTRRDVDPYVLAASGGDWYLIGLCKLRNEVRTFALDRIFNPRMLDHYFAVPKNFSAEKYFEQGFGRMRGRGDVDIKLHVRGRAVAWIERNIWHPSQTLEKKKDGSIILSMFCPLTDNLVRWVLQMGGDVLVIEPQGLKERVVEEAERLIKTNR